MSSLDSVTQWIEDLKAGNRGAAQRIWERYFRRMVGLARKKLVGARRRAEDEEDAALSAFDSFCRAPEQGRFPRLSDRYNLWPLLVKITARKAYDVLQREHRVYFGDAHVQGESAWGTEGAPGLRPGSGRR
jgi:hypothetical protein